MSPPLIAELKYAISTVGVWSYDFSRFRKYPVFLVLSPMSCVNLMRGAYPNVYLSLARNGLFRTLCTASTSACLHYEEIWYSDYTATTIFLFVTSLSSLGQKQIFGLRSTAS